MLIVYGTVSSSSASPGATPRSAEDVGPADVVAWSERIATHDRWGARRGLDRIAPGAESAVTAGIVRAADAASDEQVIFERAGDDGAVTTLHVKPMETACLGVRTGGLTNVLAPAHLPQRAQVVRRLLDHAKERARAIDLDLVVLRVDADDVDTLLAAQGAGFLVCEATVTWLIDRRQPARPYDGPMTFERHTGPPRDVLRQEDLDRLAELATSWELGHLFADARIPRSGTEAFYRTMIDNVAAGRWCDVLHVARLDGRLAAIVVEVRDAMAAQHAGIDLYSTEWFAALEPGHGVGHALVATMPSTPLPRGHHRTWETQVRNLSTIRCIEQTHLVRPVRSSYTLHLWP